MKIEVLEKLAVEVEQYRSTMLNAMSDTAPDALKDLFGCKSTLPEEVVLGQWRVSERYDELIDYILYRYELGGGEDFWKQVLLDLRLKSDDKRAFRMLEGLLPGRMDLYKAKLKNSKKYPENYLCASALLLAKAEVIKVLHEYAFILENKQSDQVDTGKVTIIKGKIEKLLKDN